LMSMSSENNIVFFVTVMDGIHAMGSKIGSFDSSFDACEKTHLDPQEYFISDSDTMTVFIPAYNITLQPHEYKIIDPGGLVICRPMAMHYTVETESGYSYVVYSPVALVVALLYLLARCFCCCQACNKETEG
jgi:hypothetical protein